MGRSVTGLLWWYKMDQSAFRFALLFYYLWVQLQCTALANAADYPPRRSVLHATFVPSITITQVSTASISVHIPNYILHLNLRQIPVQFGNIFYNADGGEVVENGLASCYYEGYVDDFPDWTVSISTCNGLEGSFGNVNRMDSYYYIEPQPQPGVIYHNKFLQPHILFSEYSTTDNSSIYGICGFHMLHGDHFMAQGLELDTVALRDEYTRNRLVEIVLVNDYTLFTTHNKRVSSVIERDMEIIDYMNQRYREFNVTFLLVGVVTWSKYDIVMFPSDNEPTQVLMAFRRYFRDIPLTYDSALLISGRNFLGNIVGLAYKSSMCYGSYAVGIVQDRQVGVSFVGGTACHELGHILGMSHDDGNERACECADITGKCIMAGLSLSVPPTTWSNCSLQDMFESFRNNPLTEVCLFNMPQLNNITTPIVLLGKSVQGQSSSMRVLIIGLLVIFICTFL